MNKTRTASAVSRQAAPRVASVSRVLPARARSVAVQAAPPKKVGGHFARFSDLLTKIDS